VSRRSLLPLERGDDEAWIGPNPAPNSVILSLGRIESLQLLVRPICYRTVVELCDNEDMVKWYELIPICQHLSMDGGKLISFLDT
jgi:hypothetical protein